MSGLPGWNSVQDAAFWAHFWFWFSIACLVALGASALVSHAYGLRKDALLEAAASSADQKRLRAQQEVQQEERDRHAAELAKLRTQLDQTSKKLDDERSLKSRTRAALAAIDAKIVRLIDGGATQLMVRMQPSDFATLTALIGEPGGSDLLGLTKTGWVQRSASINDGSLGPTASVPEQWRVVLKIGGGLRSR
ncbi:MAG: hypothetical protein JO339_13840 [Alphaproteobacteria bacterium]|nr:hypothetical protein [Alphaproteobacteria bacterium]